ncbi:hypothetical protein MP638_004898 [Amoeboaphelidium occidentale]|nr:hypothetical protein MP638_004898 [Amoeboaphelidium occidentale]
MLWLPYFATAATLFLGYGKASEFSVSLTKTSNAPILSQIKSFTNLLYTQVNSVKAASSDQLEDLLKLSYALNEYQSKLTLHYDLFYKDCEGKKDTEDAVVFLFDGLKCVSYSLEAGKVPARKSESEVQLYPFDLLLTQRADGDYPFDVSLVNNSTRSSHLSVVYAESFDLDALKNIVKKMKQVVFRWKPILTAMENKLLIRSSYGIELNVKSTEYKTTDDLSTGSDQEVFSLKSETAEKKDDLDLAQIIEKVRQQNPLKGSVPTEAALIKDFSYNLCLLLFHTNNDLDYEQKLRLLRVLSQDFLLHKDSLMKMLESTTPQAKKLKEYKKYTEDGAYISQLRSKVFINNLDYSALFESNSLTTVLQKVKQELDSVLKIKKYLYLSSYDAVTDLLLKVDTVELKSNSYLKTTGPSEDQNSFYDFSQFLSTDAFYRWNDLEKDNSRYGKWRRLADSKELIEVRSLDDLRVRLNMFNVFLTIDISYDTVLGDEAAREGLRVLCDLLETHVIFDEFPITLTSVFVLPPLKAPVITELEEQKHERFLRIFYYLQQKSSRKCLLEYMRLLAYAKKSELEEKILKLFEKFKVPLDETLDDIVKKQVVSESVYAFSARYSISRFTFFVNGFILEHLTEKTYFDTVQEVVFNQFGSIQKLAYAGYLDFFSIKAPKYKDIGREQASAVQKALGKGAAWYLYLLDNLPTKKTFRNQYLTESKYSKFVEVGEFVNDLQWAVGPVVQEDKESNDAMTEAEKKSVKVSIMIVGDYGSYKAQEDVVNGTESNRIETDVRAFACEAIKFASIPAYRKAMKLVRIAYVSSSPIEEDFIHCSNAAASYPVHYVSGIQKKMGMKKSTAVFVNGRLIEDFENNHFFKAADYKIILEQEVKALQKVKPGASGPDTFLMAISTINRLNSQQGQNREDTSKLSDTFALSSKNTEAPLKVKAFLDPLDASTQKFSAILEHLAKMKTLFDVRVYLLPTKYDSKDQFEKLLIQKRLYRYAFNLEGYDAGVTFDNLPNTYLFSMGMDVPQNWFVMPKRSKFDLDNLKFEKNTPVNAELELKYLLIEGHAFDMKEQRPPRGLQLELEHEKKTVSDTIVMANLGYYQLKADIGIFTLKLRSGASKDFYNMLVVESETGQQFYPFNGSEVQIVVDGFESVTLYTFMEKNKGYEGQDLLLDEETSGSFSSFMGWISGNSGKEKEHADINIFSVASGHLYERFLRIMIKSVLSKTKKSVKFWFIENFMSPVFKDFLPHYAKENGFKYELVSYKWPKWLRAQQEKQRTIWGYKILFLDVLFPLSLDKVIFVDADQIVRTDMYELVKMDLKGAPYGYTPFCDSRKEIDGFRFWKKGYWKEHLRDKPYHISALYVVDLKRFRAIAAGDRLRQHYQMVSKDPDSLSNLDQDLPNDMQGTVPIFSLPQEWLWCETWCDDASLKSAKTIDLCNNPMTKEPKLDRAKRLLPEWVVFDDEQRKEFDAWRTKNKTEEKDMRKVYQDAMRQIRDI